MPWNSLPSSIPHVVQTPLSLPLREEVSSLLDKEAIEPVPQQHQKMGFYSRYFTVPKKDGGLRPIMDLRFLNKYISCRKFRMTTLQSILPLLPPDSWMVMLDLRDIYFHIAIKLSHQHFLRFTVGTNHYQYKVLPFSLSCAPRVFTKIMVVIAT